MVKNCSILAAVGHRMASTPDVSANLFDALSKVCMDIQKRIRCVECSAE